MVSKEHIYLAARYGRRDELRRVRDKLNKRGFLVTSRWLDENEPLNSQMGEQCSEWYCQTQEVDLIDIRQADSLLFFSEDPLCGIPRGGRHVEFGYALARSIPIYVIGPRENVFHYNCFVKHFDSLEDFLATTNGR